MKTIQIATISIFLSLLMVHLGFAQSSPAGALENVEIHLANGNVIQSGTIVWRDGVIEEVGRNVEIPYDAQVIDGGDSLHVYPGFIDGLAHWGSPELPESFEDAEDPGDPGYERAGIEPQRRLSEHLENDQETFEAALKSGFTTGNLGLRGFMLPGQLEIYFIDEEVDGSNIYKKAHGLYGQFEEAPGDWGSSVYPGTQMGVMARFRQLMYEAEALKEHTAFYASSSNMPSPKNDEVLESLFPLIDNEQPLYFTVDKKEDIERLFWLQDEFDFDAVIVSGKEAYTKAKELAERNIPVLAAFDLPEQPDWMEEKESDEELSDEEKTYRERQKEEYGKRLKNISELQEAGVEVGFASHGLKTEKLKKNTHNLLEEGGLDEEDILALFTRQTASILEVDNTMGNLEEGKIASFSVFTAPFTDEEAEVSYSVSNGSIKDFN